MAKFEIKEGKIVGVKVFGKIIPTKEISFKDKLTVNKLGNAVDILHELVDRQFMKKRQEREKRNQYVKNRKKKGEKKNGKKKSI